MDNKNFKYDDLSFIKGVFERTTEAYIFIYDLLNDHYLISQRACEYFNLSEYDFTDASNRLKEVVHPDDYLMVVEDLNQIKNKKKSKHSLEYRWKTRAGSYAWIRCSGEAVAGSNGEYLIGTITEIGKIKRIDNITGLYFESVLEADYKKGNYGKNRFGGILLIGIDNFKEINEKHGTEMGNKVLENLASIILSIVKDARYVYRMNGDEFAVAVPEPLSDREKHMKRLYKKIRRGVDAYFEANGYELFFTISAGGVEFDSENDKYE
ncbi:MAG: sensor domain-containing diguanylate cyclase, partial [Eubacteriales bacterium]|nr:sensor domain-containing diguanylate cyclase [Eubacteriales bacterium]